MEPIAHGLGLPLPSLGLGFGFGFGATLAGGRARSLELEEATSCDACAFTRVDASSLARSYFTSLTELSRNTCPDSPDVALRSPDRSTQRNAAQRVKVWGQQESNRPSLGSVTRFPIGDQGRLKTPKINKRTGACIWYTRVDGNDYIKDMMWQSRNRLARRYCMDRVRASTRVLFFETCRKAPAMHLTQGRLLLVSCPLCLVHCPRLPYVPCRPSGDFDFPVGMAKYKYSKMSNNVPEKSLLMSQMVWIMSQDL